MKARFGPIITVLLAVAATIGVTTAFIANASPYVTVSEARKTGATNVHLKGELDKTSIRNDLQTKTIHFRVKDKDGESMEVIYSGTPPQDMSQATEIVAIGSMKGTAFHSDKLLIKCPSKYESVPKAIS